MACNLLNSRMPWTPEEDQRLRAAVARYGVKRWSQIAALLPGRTSKACSHRWRTYLQPGVMHTSTNPFTEWEVAVVREAHSALGNNWSAIARMLPGRTNAAVKNFWYAYTRRAQRATSRGHHRRSGTSAHVTSTSDADAEDDDADMDSADEDDDVDGECESVSEGEMAAEDLDADGDDVLQVAMHGTDHMMAEGLGDPCMTAADNHAGAMAASVWPSDFCVPIADHQHHENQQQQQHDTPPENGPADADKGLLQLPAVAMCTSARASPVTPEIKASLITNGNSNTPGNLSSSCHPGWAAYARHQHTYTDSPEVPPTRESAAGAPPGTHGVSDIPGSPMVPPNGHSCAGAPPASHGVSDIPESPAVPPSGHSCAGAPPGSAAGTALSASPEISLAAASAAGRNLGNGSGTDHLASLVVPRLSQCVLEVDPATRVGTFTDPMQYVAVEDLSSDDMHQSSAPQAVDVGADQALIRDLSGCLVDLHLPGDGASPSALLPDHLLPFNENEGLHQLNFNSQQQQQQLLPHLIAHTNQSSVSKHATFGAHPPPMSATGALPAAAGTTAAHFYNQYGVAQMPTATHMQTHVSQMHRVTEMHNHGILGHVGTDNNKGSIQWGMTAAAGGLVGVGISNSSSSTASMWATDSCSYEQMLLRHSCCSDGGVGSSSNGCHPNLAGQMMQQHHQQLHVTPARDCASRFYHQQQQHKSVFESMNTASPSAADMCQVSMQQQHPKPQLPHRLAKRFCLDLSDEALAAEQSAPHC